MVFQAQERETLRQSLQSLSGQQSEILAAKAVAQERLKIVENQADERALLHKETIRCCPYVRCACAHLSSLCLP